MKKVGITGQNGFIGSHLFNTLSLDKENYEIIAFQKSYFENENALDEFVQNSDVIVHLAALNRSENESEIYAQNIRLVELLTASLIRTRSNAHVLFSSSSQELRDNPYGKSKKEGRALLSTWAEESNGTFTGMIIPNIFGPFGKPFYNSFVATFCYQLCRNEQPRIDHDSEIALLYVGELVKKIIQLFSAKQSNFEHMIEAEINIKVSEVLKKLADYQSLYLVKGEIPSLNNYFEIQLFNTFRSFIDYNTHFPVKLKPHKDERGAFVEVIRLGIGGQCSFSTTVPGITRGNHFHTRKIERFTVIKGKARIQLRKIDCDEVLNFFLDGEEPSYVDIPIWYTHNITNIGEDELLTIFWINEPFNALDADTYFLNVS